MWTLLQSFYFLDVLIHSLGNKNFNQLIHTFSAALICESYILMTQSCDFGPV